MDGVAADPDAAPALDALLPEAYADLRQIA
jgi:hypothetical protein